MKRTITRIGALLLAMSMVLPLAACGGKTSSNTANNNSGTASSASAENKDPVRIGLACALSGSSAAYGDLQHWAANLAAEEINAAGGINGRMIEIVALDDAQDEAQAPVVAQKFCDDPTIIGVVAHGGSSLSAATQPIFEEAGLCNIAPASSSNYLAEQGYKQWMRIVVSDLAQAPRMAAFAKNNLGCSKMAIIYSNTDSGIGIVENIESVSGKLGLEIVGKETYNPGTESDFSTLITKVKSLGADCICLQSNYQDGGIILKQMKELGLELPVISLSTLTYRATIELAGVDAVQNLYCVCTFNPFSEAQINKDFLAKYTAAYGEDQIPSSPCGLTYDAVHVIAKAVEQGATRENLADWIMNRISGNDTFVMEEMLLGPDITWADNGNVSSFVSSVVRVDENGEFVAYGDVDTTGLE